MNKIQSVRLRNIDFNFMFDKLDERLDSETVIQIFTRNGALSFREGKSKWRPPRTLDNISTLVGIKTQEKGLELLFKTDPSVPTALVGDPLRLGQILINW
jgi:hypothetical protein